MTRIYLIRHGQASFHAADYDQLSDTGVEQSRLLGGWFEDCGWQAHHLVAGGMRRHLQTAEGFFDTYADAPDWRERLQRDEGFNEFNHKEILSAWFAAEDPEAVAKGSTFNNLTKEEFEVKMFGALARWASGKFNSDYEESWPMFRERCMGAFEKAFNQAQRGENVLAFTSCGTISAICREILGVSEEQMVHLMWQISNGSVTSITRKHGRYALTAFNATAHIDRSGRPELLTLK